MIDVVDILGTRNDNITKNVNKWNVDEYGQRMGYDGRNRDQPEIEHDTHHNIEDLHANGIHALSIAEAQFPNWVKEHEFSFVNFYAPCEYFLFLTFFLISCIQNKI